MSWTPGTKRQSRIGSLGQLLREPPGSICSRAKPSFAPASLALNLLARSLLPCIRARLRKRIESAVSPALRVGPALHYSCSDRLALRSCSFRACRAITIAFASPSFLPARRPSCILRASELASSIRPLLRHQRSPWRS
jgi:hypothetical protein